MTYSMMVGKYKLIFSDTHFKDFRKKPTISVYDADTNSETKIASFNSQETFEWFIEAVVEADRKDEPFAKDINVRSKDKPQICDTCRYYNSDIPCGSTPSACKEADKFAEEFVDGLKKLKTEPQTEDKHAVCTGCDYYDLPNAFHPCASCVDFSKYKPKIEDEPHTERSE